ncbi:MAG: ribosome biogenesis GTP-binding protein YihA/YsxC [Pseudomonadota bacterium]|nr:ribosome biogenesis GTP-binding protein YihA/YsxC [Pseudomonadota bacterium]
MRDTQLDPRLAQTKFLISAPTLAHCPPECGPEIGFCGRSNAGKSSALNALTGQKSLARVSKTPGRTQLINFFEVPHTGGFLVDLPGYGFAKVPEAMKKQWQQHLGEFLAERRTLTGLVLLMDVRHPMTTLDEQMLSFADHRDIHTLLLLTKSDKLSRNQAAKARLTVQKRRPQSLVLNFSSLDKTGITETSAWINHHLHGSEQ